MEAFFDTVPDSQKLRLLDGSVLHDTAIVPDFLERGLCRDAWTECLARPDCDADALILDFENPRWVTGENTALNYRGRAIPRDKMWYQRSMATMLRYGYTGWQWAVSAGTYRLGAMPALEALVDATDAKMGMAHAHNHWIVTRYAEGKDCIGMHSDKVKDWAVGSAFAVVKLGAPRAFVFTQHVGGKDVEIYNKVLQPGTAVIVGYDANQMVKHGVPPEASAAPSGSIVGRCIVTEASWPAVQSAIAKSAALKARSKARKEAGPPQVKKRQLKGPPQVKKAEAKARA